MQIRKPTAMDLMDPNLALVDQAAQIAQNIKEDDVVALGGELVAHWKYSLNEMAQFHTLERLVKESALKKVFDDGQVFEAITSNREVEVKFFRVPGDHRDTGLLLTTLNGGENAMKLLLERADLSDLDLMPRPSQKPKKKPKDAPKTVELKFEGATLQAQLKEEPVKEQQSAPGFNPEAAMAPVPMNMQNPLVQKKFIQKMLTANVHNVPCPDAKNMAIMSLLAASSEIHPQDEVWPEGMTVTNVLSGKVFESPKEALKTFEKSLEKKVGGVEVTREDVRAQFAARLKR